jgi:hypothetical protein
MVAITASVLVSNAVTVLARPLLAKPRPSSGTSATPCTPAVSAISPSCLPLSASSTSTCVDRGTYSRRASLSTVT